MGMIIESVSIFLFVCFVYTSSCTNMNAWLFLFSVSLNLKFTYMK